MSFKIKILAGVCGIGMFMPALAMAATPISAGYYAVSGYVISATPAAACAELGVKTGDTYAGVLFYPGAGKAGTTFRTENENDAKGGGVGIQEFPVAPAAGVTTWSGTSKFGEEGGTLIPVPFSVKFTFLDAFSGLATLSAKIPLSATVACTEVDRLVLVKSGA